MRDYWISFAAGIIPPAPPVIALVGLLSIAGEQVIPAVKRLIADHAVDATWIRSECVPHVFGSLPTRTTAIGSPATQQERLS